MHWQKVLQSYVKSARSEQMVSIGAKRRVVQFSTDQEVTSVTRRGRKKKKRLRHPDSNEPDSEQDSGQALRSEA